MKDIILVGFGGHAKSIADSIENKKEYNIVGYTDVCEKKSCYKYLGTDLELERYFNMGIEMAVVGVGYLGNSVLREDIYNKLKKIGYKLPIIVDKTAVISPSVHIEEGTFVGKNAVINTDASIGKMCIINTMSLVEHECIVGDFSHVAVGAILCGQVEIGRGSFIGASSTIIQCVKVEGKSIIPAGVTVR